MRPARHDAPTPVTHGTLDARLRVGGFQLTETTHGARMRLARHAHDDDAITLVLRGGFAESFGGRAVECRRGGLLIKPAAAVAVPPTRLARAFRQRVGETPGAYQRRLRLERARGDLLRTARPIAEVAADAGFTDQSHLTRAFAHAFGATPGAYRRHAGRDADDADAR